MVSSVVKEAETQTEQGGGRTRPSLLYAYGLDEVGRKREGRILAGCQVPVRCIWPRQAGARSMGVKVPRGAGFILPSGPLLREAGCGGSGVASSAAPPPGPAPR